MFLFADILGLGIPEFIILAVLAVLLFGGVFWRLRRRW
jgi:hypothetical protein